MKLLGKCGEKLKDASELKRRLKAMTEDKVSVDRKQLLTILVQVENALEEVKQLKKEIRKKEV